MHENGKFRLQHRWRELPLLARRRLLFFLVSPLYSQSLITTYSEHDPRGEARDANAAEGYLPDKLLGDTKASLMVKCEGRQTGHTLLP